MNQYTEKPLGAYTIGDIDWEFGQFLETGAYYIKCLDYPGISQTIWMAEDEKEARDSAMDFIDRFLDQNC